MPENRVTADHTGTSDYVTPFRESVRARKEKQRALHHDSTEYPPLCSWSDGLGHRCKAIDGHQYSRIDIAKRVTVANRGSFLSDYRRPFFPLLYLKSDSVALFEGLETDCIDAGMVNEYVRTIFLLNETISLLITKPLYSSICHNRTHPPC